MHLGRAEAKDGMWKDLNAMGVTVGLPLPIEFAEIEKNYDAAVVDARCTSQGSQRREKGPT